MSARPAPRKAAKAATPETALIRSIMAACRRHGIDNDARYDIQKEIIGKASLKDMTVAELTRLRDHFNRGWKGPNQHRPHIGKIRALWWSLYWIGAIERPDDEALTAFVRRRAHVQHLNFLDHRAASPVIEGLKAWLEREGVLWWSAEKVEQVARVAGIPFAQAEADRHAVLDQLGDRLDRAGLLRKFALYDWIGNAVERPTPNQWSFSAAELDEGIKRLGKKYRAHLAKEQRL